jgi:hypothetical protein
MGAAQALASPFFEVHLCLVFLPLVWGAYAGWDALSTIRLMAAGGTVGFLLK